MRIEQVILGTLVHDEEYTRKVIPFLKPEYFQDSVEKIIFEKIEGFVTRYNKNPTRQTLLIELEKDEHIGEDLYDKSVKYVKDIDYEKKEPQWLIDQTEDFCQDRSMYSAIMESVRIIDGDHKTKDRGSIPKIVSDALAVSFDKNLGHDYFGDAMDRYDRYNRKEERIPFDIERLNKITGGGLKKKTLNIWQAGTGVGKTMLMCHQAASNLMDGKNVLYITLEMSEDEISMRVDANLMNIPMDSFEGFPKDTYENKINSLKRKTQGRLVVREYPTAAAGSGHFRHLLNELALKDNFFPDVLYIDYLNICLSSRFKGAANISSYNYVKSVAEELRGLAVEKSIPIVTATQTNRTGFVNSDPGLEDTSESFGVPMTADLMVAITRTEKMDELGQLMFKQLKNRYSDPTKNRRFVVGVDIMKMRLFNVEQTAQAEVLNETTDKDDNTPKFGKKKKKDFSQLFN